MNIGTFTAWKLRRFITTKSSQQSQFSNEYFWAWLVIGRYIYLSRRAWIHWKIWHFCAETEQMFLYLSSREIRWHLWSLSKIGFTEKFDHFRAQMGLFLHLFLQGIRFDISGALLTLVSRKNSIIFVLKCDSAYFHINFVLTSLEPF